MYLYKPILSSLFKVFSDMFIVPLFRLAKEIFSRRPLYQALLVAGAPALIYKVLFAAGLLLLNLSKILLNMIMLLLYLFILLLISAGSRVLILYKMSVRKGLRPARPLPCAGLFRLYLY